MKPIEHLVEGFFRKGVGEGHPLNSLNRFSAKKNKVGDILKILVTFFLTKQIGVFVHFKSHLIHFNPLA